MGMRFGNGLPYSIDEKGRRVDTEGYAVGTPTIITNMRLTCVSVKMEELAVKVRNSNDPTKTTCEFTKDEWRAFVKGVKKGEFDV